MNTSRFLSIFFPMLEKIWLQDISNKHSEHFSPVYKGAVVKTLINLQTCQIWSLEVVKELSHNEKWVLQGHSHQSKVAEKSKSCCHNYCI